MALDAIGLIGGKDRLQEISMRLDDSHLAYLQLDDSPLKLQARHKLEGFIKEYLCHVPNERKYIFQETADILHRSAATVKNFSGYRACTAWSAVSLYAANLLAQPWRKEYRTLRTYSGYYKHEIEANLIGAELMFELMGYKHTGLGVLTLEGPIDPDKVSSVSRDAIVALVECQILKEIWESVSKNFTISWLEVLEFRWNSVGTSETAIRALNFRFLERMHQIRDKNSSTLYRADYRHPQPIGIDPSLSSLTPAALPYHMMTNNYNTTIIPGMRKPDSVYPSDGSFYFTPMDSGTLSNRFVNPYVCAPPLNRYYPMSPTAQGNSTIVSLPGHATRVPTGRLIELDTPLPVANYERNVNIPNEIAAKSAKSRNHESEIDEVDYRDGDRADYARVEKKSSKLSHNNDEGKINDWEFVYKSLESLGYSKDLGEREDVLRKRELLMEARNNSSRGQQKTARSLANIDTEKYGNHSSSREEKRKNEIANHGKATNFNDDDSSGINGQETPRGLVYGKKSSLDWQDATSTIVDPTINSEKINKKYSNTLPAARSVYKSCNDQQTTIKNVETTRDNKPAVYRDNSIRWNCATCTFLNPAGREICEMCGKSRKKGNEDKPLASGGKECPQCTLVNEKNAATCEACGASLKDSPTYI